MRRSAGVVVVLAMVLAACAGNQRPGAGDSGQRSTRAVSGSTVSVAGLPDAQLTPLTAPLTYAQAGYDLQPPPSSSVPGVTAEKAYATCLVDAVCLKDQGPSISLAVVTQDGATGGGHINPDGSVTPFLDHSLTWVITYSGESCPAPAGPGPSRSPATTCSIVDFVSAETGAVIMSVEGADL